MRRVEMRRVEMRRVEMGRVEMGRVEMGRVWDRSVICEHRLGQRFCGAKSRVLQSGEPGMAEYSREDI